MMNIFEKAAKEAIRFEYKGLISAEDLWQLDVHELDSIFKVLNAEKKQVTEDSLLETTTKENTLLNTKIKIITYIVKSKLAEAEARTLLAEKKVKKEKIMAVLANKQDSELEGKSAEELQEMLESL